MTSLDRKKLREHEERILRGLVKFYYEQGHALDAYRDDDTGGIYEHKLAKRLGYPVNDMRSPPEFLEACRALEAQGYVRRTKRKRDIPELGIWPTLQGLDHAAYLDASRLKRIWLQVEMQWPQIIVSIVTTILTTIVTLVIASLLGLFGLSMP